MDVRRNFSRGCNVDISLILFQGANGAVQMDLQDGVKQEIHPKAFRLTLFKGCRQNEVEILPSWFIYKREENSLVKAVANKKGFRR